jgi:hypothetical protein
MPTTRHLVAVGDPAATRPGRSSCTPAYYQGRPAGLLLEIFGGSRRRRAASAGGQPSREHGGVRGTDGREAARRARAGHAA